MPPAGGPVVGSANRDLVIDRMSGRIEHLIAEPAHVVVGRSLLEVVVLDDTASLLSALAGRPGEQRGVRLPAKLRGSCRLSGTGELVVLPMVPVASCIFAFAEASANSGIGPAEAIHRQLQGGATRVAAGSPDPSPVPSASVPGAGRLTDRERDIVERLLSGDRVPTIARQLYLSQSTVRNRLSAVYRKLGVNSQQELIDLWRRRYESSDDR